MNPVVVAVGAVLVAVGLLLLIALAVTHEPADDPYDQPHREVVPWP